MFYVYVLLGLNNKIYIGYTSDLRRRLKEHIRGDSYWTRRLSSPKLYYYEAYPTKELACEREKRLKYRGSAKTGLLRRIRLK